MMMPTHRWTLRKRFIHTLSSSGLGSNQYPWRTKVRNRGILVVGVVGYLLFLVATLYGISFTLGGFLPHPFAFPAAPAVPALLIDVGLIALFGVPHSAMARPRWKRWWTTIIPPVLERSLYVLLASC